MMANRNQSRNTVILTKRSGMLAGVTLLIAFGLSAPWLAYGEPPTEARSATKPVSRSPWSPYGERDDDDDDDRLVRMDMRFAGTFFSSDDLNVGHFRANGKPGKANIRFVTIPGPGLPPEFNSDCCTGTASPACLLAHNTENPLIFTFDDLSLLFANIKTGTVGDICVDLSPGGKVQARIEVEFTGGRGRFEGATGEAVVVAEIEAVSPDGTFSGETGTIVGEIVLP